MIPYLSSLKHSNKTAQVDDRDHYIFTPRDLTAWIDQLGYYEVNSQAELLRAWGECVAALSARRARAKRLTFRLARS